MTFFIADLAGLADGGGGSNLGGCGKAIIIANKRTAAIEPLTVVAIGSGPSTVESGIASI